MLKAESTSRIFLNVGELCKKKIKNHFWQLYGSGESSFTGNLSVCLFLSRTIKKPSLGLMTIFQAASSHNKYSPKCLNI